MLKTSLFALCLAASPALAQNAGQKTGNEIEKKGNEIEKKGVETQKQGEADAKVADKVEKNGKKKAKHLKEKAEAKKEEGKQLQKDGTDAEKQAWAGYLAGDVQEFRPLPRPSGAAAPRAEVMIEPQSPPAANQRS